jgi:hypothetical protein
MSLDQLKPWTQLAVAILILFPQISIGMVNKENTPMRAPNTPKGIAGPALVTHSPAKKVHEKLIIALMQVTATKQSAASGP